MVGRAGKDGANRVRATLFVACKDLGIEEAERRLLVRRVTGKGSTKDCTAPELVEVVEELRRMGWKGTPKSYRRAEARKVAALWAEAHDLGVVDDRSDAALNLWVKRMTRIDRLEWVDERRDFTVLLAALKAMVERAGGVTA